MRGKVQPLPTSLMSAAHTVKPSLPAAAFGAIAGAVRKSRLNIVALGALSAVLGLIVAVLCAYLAFG